MTMPGNAGEQRLPSGLEQIDYTQLFALTEQESVTVDGQIAKMRLVEEMILARLNDMRRRLFARLQSSVAGEEARETAVASQMQALRIHHLDLGDGRYNLIVERGEGDDETPDTTIYRVMVVAHVDTVEGLPHHNQLEQDLANPDRWKGRGVYDMGAGVINSIALASAVQVPEGMKVYFVFTVDEEEDSLGALQLVRQWDVWPHIDAVISSDIGPLKPLPDDDPRMRLIIARCGREKCLGTITIAPGQQGHGAQTGLPNASDALVELLGSMREQFYRGRKGSAGERDESPVQQSHSLLGVEEFETGAVTSTQRDGYVLPHEAKFRFAVKTVPPTARGEMLKKMKRTASGIAHRGEWHGKHGIDHTLVADDSETSYPPYEMPDKHPMVRVAAGILRRISGVDPEIVGGPSVADECVYADSMLEGMELPSFDKTPRGIITIPPNGDHAHSPDEWVSKMNIARVRQAVRLLIENPDGLISLAQKRMA